MHKTEETVEQAVLADQLGFDTFWCVERKGDGAILGFCGLKRCNQDGGPIGMMEVGWRLREDAWGQGYAFEAARAALAYGRDELGLGEVISLIRSDNLRSIALAERLGARRDGGIDFMGQHALLYRHPVAGA